VGFLDRQSRVIDVVLTGRGRELLARGELDFAYYAFFDDGIDYDPWSPEPLTDEERDDLIHSSPMLEAPIVQDRRSNILPLEPTSFLFKAAPDYLVLPRLLHPHPTGSWVGLQCDQLSSGSSFIRSSTTRAMVPLELTGETAGAAGFSIHVYVSGTNGLTELSPKFDLSGRRAIDPFVAFSIDDEAVVRGPDNSTRRGRR
jgi:hypothetical protein